MNEHSWIPVHSPPGCQTRHRWRGVAVASGILSFGMLSSSAAKAASLQQAADWGATNVPGDVSMHIYVPDAVANDPPVRLLVHYCGGTAPAVFDQARGGGVVGAADQYGFIMVVPSSGRCWDVVSDQSRTRGA